MADDLVRPTRLDILGRGAWSTLGLMGVVAVVLWILVHISTVVIPLIVALLVCAGMAPVTGALHRRGFPTWLAAGLVLLLAVALLLGLLVGIVVLVIPQMGQLGTALQQGLDTATTSLQQGVFGLPAINVSDLASTVRTNLAAGPLTPRVLGAATTAGRLLTSSAVCLIAVFFFLKDGPTLWVAVRRPLPLRWQPHALALGERVWTVTTSYVRGQVAIAAIDGVAMGIGLAVLGVPLALPLGALVAVFALFPVVGAITGSLLAVLVALADGGVSLAATVVVLGLVVFQVEAHLLSPWLLGRQVALHPLMVVIALTLGGLLGGVVGALLAVPLAAVASQIAGYAMEATGRPTPEAVAPSGRIPDSASG